MSSTNKTSHYNLSQYVSSDKPTYLVDYNTDMSNIDTGIYNAKNEADTNATNIGTLSNLTTTAKTSLVSAINEIDGNTDTNTSNIGTLSSLTTTSKTDLVGAINEVDANADTNTTNIGTLTNLTTTVKSDLVNAINELKTNIDNFNLSVFTSLDSQNITTTNGTLVDPVVTVAKNSDGSLAKIYGRIILTNITAQTLTVTISGTGLAPSSNFTINNAGMERITYSGNYYYSIGFDILVKTTGDVDITLSGLYSYDQIVLDLLPMLYFIKDFGDVPIQ